jgi:hypothetical protein
MRDQLARSRHPAGPKEIRMLGQRLHGTLDHRLHAARGGRIASRDIADDRGQIVACRGTPDDGSHGHAA